MMQQATQSDGTVIKVGQVVGFKCDVEQYGKVVEIKGSFSRIRLVLEGNFCGEYIGGETRTTILIDDAWTE